MGRASVCVFMHTYIYIGKKKEFKSCLEFGAAAVCASWACGPAQGLLSASKRNRAQRCDVTVLWAAFPVVARSGAGCQFYASPPSQAGLTLPAPDLSSSKRLAFPAGCFFCWLHVGVFAKQLGETVTFADNESVSKCCQLGLLQK